MSTMRRAQRAMEAGGARPHLLRRATPYLLLGPALLLLGFVLVYPILYNIYLSLFNWRFTDPGSVHFVGLGNYVKLFHSGLFWQVAEFSMSYVVITIVAEFLLGLAGAMLLASLFRSRKWFATLLLLPYLVAPIAVGLDWRLLWNHDFGLINWLVGLVGIGPVNWLGNSELARVAVAVTEIWRSTPFVTIILLAGLTGIPAEAIEAARIDGATAWQEFFHVILPLLRPSLTIALLFQTIIKLRVFDLVYILTGGGPGIATTPFGILEYRTYFRYFNGGDAATIAVVLLLLGALISFGYIRLVYREVEY